MKATFKRSIAACLIATVGIIPFTAEANSLNNMRGARYCEILLTKKGLNMAVYNTINLNGCPEDLWKKITVQSIKKETGSFFVHLNGPRYFLFDRIENASLINKKQRVFQGLAMHEAGVLHLNASDLFKRRSPYKTHEVARQTTWVYFAGKPVYELLSPTGEAYVMQSYSVQDIPQTEADLSTLGTRLKLPSGWTFKTGLLKKEAKVVAIDGKAIVTTDDFLNTYQKATHDLLNDAS
jgi:hypothetical protein